jgi:putative tryptophan/tyrosine transport system substrate-binding protein
MRRREFIALLGGTAGAWSFAAHAEKAERPVIGFLNAAAAGPYARFVEAFRRGLGETGYVEGHNVDIEYRWADGHNDRLSALAADLVSRRVSVIAVPGSTPGALAAKAATNVIPIVFAIGSDPVRAGLINSLGRPGGNVTGVTVLGAELAPKQLELLHQVTRGARSMAVLINPSSAAISEAVTQDLHTSAHRLQLALHILRASTDNDLDNVFGTLVHLRAGGLVIASDAFFTSQVRKLADLSIRNSIPAIYWSREYVTAGGLISYGTSYTESYRQAGIYTGRILKGEKPSDLPVQQASRIELYINLKTAKVLGLDLPGMLLARADEVIE